MSRREPTTTWATATSRLPWRPVASSVRATTPSSSTASPSASSGRWSAGSAEQVALQQRRTAAVAGAGARQLALGIISLVAFIPISIALGVNGEFLALLVTLVGIVGVNVAHAWQSAPTA